MLDDLVDILREQILTGALPAASWIRQDALAQSLGLSKIPVREALRQLERDGLVESRALRGFFVRPLDATEAGEIFALRLRIEPDLFGRAAARLTPQAIAEAAKTLEALEDGILRGAAFVGRLNRDFHLALARPAAGPVAIDMLGRLLFLSERYVVAHLAPEGRDSLASQDHKELFEAWCRQESDKVEEIAAAHIRRTASDLAVQLK